MTPKEIKEQTLINEIELIKQSIIDNTKTGEALKAQQKKLEGDLEVVRKEPLFEVVCIESSACGRVSKCGFYKVDAERAGEYKLGSTWWRSSRFRKLLPL